MLRLKQFPQRRKEGKGKIAMGIVSWAVTSLLILFLLQWYRPHTPLCSSAELLLTAFHTKLYRWIRFYWRTKENQREWQSMVRIANHMLTLSVVWGQAGKVASLVYVLIQPVSVCRPPTPVPVSPSSKLYLDPFPAIRGIRKTLLGALLCPRTHLSPHSSTFPES